MSDERTRNGFSESSAGAGRSLSPPADSLTNPLWGILLFVVLAGVAALSILLLRPPAPLPVTASADQFSAARAVLHIQAIASEPHPVGWAAHDAVKAYLVEQLEQLGLEPRVQKTLAVSGPALVTVENVLARLPGLRDGGKAVLLNAHYDSVATGPGASDDTSGVAALLETARALTAGGRPLANDIIFFFSDCEELGWLGGTAFVQEHPWAKDVGLALVFDPTQVSGPHYVLATSANDNWLVSQLADAVSHPVADSFETEYRRQRDIHRSDFDAFDAGGYPALLVGTLGDPGSYHTLIDNPANVDLDSLQHQGSYALSLARQFGNMDLTVPQSGSAVFFNVLGSRLLAHYPRVWTYPLVALGALACIAAVLVGLRRGYVALRGLLLGAGASLLVAVILAGIGYLLWRLIVVIYPQYAPENYEAGATTYNAVYYSLAFMTLGVGLAAVMQSWLRTRIRGTELALGALLLWLILAVAASVTFAGASYAFTWPLLFGSIALLGWFLLPRSPRGTAWRIGWLTLFTLPSVILLAPVLSVGARGLSIHEVWIPMAVLGIVTGLLALPLELMSRPRKSWLPALLGLAFVGFLVAGHMTSSYNENRPLRDGVDYALSMDEGKAYWMGAFGTEVDAWTAQFFGKDGVKGDYRMIFPWEHEAECYCALAPPVDLPEPEVKQLPTTGDEDFLLHVATPPGSSSIYLFTMPGPVPGVTYRLEGKIIDSEGLLILLTPPAGGLDVAVNTSELDSLTLRVVSVTPGLPMFPGVSYTPRPAWIVPVWGDATAVAKTFIFERETGGP